MKFEPGPFKSPLARYVISTGVVLAAFLIYKALGILVGGNLPTYTTFYPAVIFIALFAGLKTVILAAFLDAISCGDFANGGHRVGSGLWSWKTPTGTLRISAYLSLPKEMNNHRQALGIYETPWIRPWGNHNNYYPDFHSLKSSNLPIGLPFYSYIITITFPKSLQ
jgi:hypothetical protein